MMGHPSNPDPYSERQQIPRYGFESDPLPADDPSGFISALLVITLPLSALCFAAGYLVGVWVWL